MTHRILMISNDEHAVSPIRQFLTHRGHVVHATSELAVAEALLLCTHYSLVVLEVDPDDSPEIDRLDLASFARDQSALTRVILVVGSGLGHERWLPDSGDIDALLPAPLALPALQAIENLFLGMPS